MLMRDIRSPEEMRFGQARTPLQSRERKQDLHAGLPARSSGLNGRQRALGGRRLTKEAEPRVEDRPVV